MGKKYSASWDPNFLAWILAQGKIVMPIPGTKDVKLSPEDLAAIRKAAEKADGLHFDRYAPGMVEKVFVDTAIPL
ncbi:Aldo-keto reductase yakc [NADP(+)] [Psilocybe cubensis]|uniref:Aldo-keto reductase yakc [NADP(+)] n=1 Tax=Psilocybe cubensis TaxID=181762 RepID=A0ACB8GNU9_PSICU|nr:Aldo-keto reductase yakc [NADP(+)] [Psilocybe cubensis]KAH9477393.1 Aldo-keto reductase yakc [NADP(+)] [Psilocybe cubensis]